MPTGRSRVAFIAFLALLAAFVVLTPAFGPGPLRAQGTEDLSGDTGLEAQRQVEALMDRMRALYAQGRYNEAIDVANQIMSADPENKIAFLFKDMSERRLLEGRTSPPVVSNISTPVARATPPPIEYVPPPVIVPRKRSALSWRSIKENPLVLTIVIVVAVLILVAVVLGVVVMRRNRDRAIGGARRDGLTDMPTQKSSSLTDLPTRKGLADMPTAKGMADMPTARGGVADMQTRQEGGGVGLYGLQGPVTTPAPPPPAPKQEPALTGMSPLVSDDEVRRPQFAPAPALAPPAAQEPVASSPESKSYLNLDLSDSQVSDVEATAHGRMAGTGAPPFAPAAASGAPKSKESRSMALPPIAAAPDIAAQGPPDTQAPPISLAPPSDMGGDDPFAAPAPLFDTGGDDSFAAPPPTAMGPPSGIVAVPSIMKPAAPPVPAVPADEKTVDPAISFNSLMFGAAPDPPSAVGLPPAPPAKAAPVEDDSMSKTSFNRQFDEVMMGPGTEKTGIAIDLGPAVEAAKDKTQAVPSPKAAAAQQQDLDMTVEIEPVTAKPQSGGLGSASSSSMFARQFESGKAAFNSGDYSKAVQCLSVAATLRPTDMEVRQLLDEARKRRRG